MDNPVRYQDPEGDTPNDYFDKSTGAYLGTDDDPINNDVRVIEEHSWQIITETDNSNDMTTLLKSNSEQISSKNTGELPMEKIFNYYYEKMGYALSELTNNSLDVIPAYANSLGTTKYGGIWKDIPKGMLQIDIDGKGVGGIIKNRYDFINFLVHERGGHGEDFKNDTPYDGYDAENRNEWETRATKLQVNHPSWKNASPEFREYILSIYGNFIK